MANSIDFGTLALGALVGVGCRKQLKAAGRVAASTMANLAGVAATAAAQVAAETKSAPSLEEQAAATMLHRIDQQLAGGQGKGQKKDH